MPRAYLSFNLPEELYEWKITHNASSYYSTLRDLSQNFRELREHVSAKKKYTAEEMEQIFWDVVKDNDISLDL
jgi:hypothetical protein